jgi:hypothetical protein
MKLNPQEYAWFRSETADFSQDHTEALDFVRNFFNIPENRFFSVLQDGSVVIDRSRKREVEAKKLSKSDQ